MPNFGYLVGNDSDKGLLLNVDEIAISGCTDIYLLRVRDPKDYTLMHFPPNFGRRKMSREYSDYDCLLNLVTDADANAKVLSTIKNSLVNYRGRLINKPTLVARTTRDLVSQACADIPEMITPKVLRFRGNISNNGLRAVLKNNDFQFPAILRKIGTHTGLSAIFVRCPEDIFHNISKKDSYYITEFFDYKSNDGLWRKYRVFVIGGNIIFRHLLIGEIWSVHAQNRKNYMAGKKPLLLEESILFERGLPENIITIIASISSRLKLDFFGIDFGISEGKFVLFEANATMNFFPFVSDPQFDYVRQCLLPAQKAFDRLLYGPAGSIIN